jgi:hypothetical protein
MIDDLIQHVVRGMCSEQAQAAYSKEIVQPVVTLAGALGFAVDTIVLSVLRARGVEHYKRRDLVITLDRGLARGARDARERKRLREEAERGSTR